jgi:hypothetical protein
MKHPVQKMAHILTSTSWKQQKEKIKICMIHIYQIVGKPSFSIQMIF